MAIHQLDFVCPEGDASAEATILRPVLAALASSFDASTVAVHRHTPEAWSGSPTHAGRPLSDAPPALIILDTDIGPLAEQIADHLAASLAPALVLLPPGQPGPSWLGSSGIVTDTTTAPAERIAAMLHALHQRQSTVRSMAGELLVAHRASGGLRGEMDRLHEELNLASLVQREFMPKHMPQIDGVDLGVIFRPTGYVSGDIYQVRMLDDRHVAIFLADAVGHGVPAALLTMIVTNSLSPLDESGRVRPPADVLRRLNANLCESQHSASRFATAVYCVLDTLTHEFTVAGAGHPPPLILGVGTCEKIETEGPLLGVFAEAEFNQVSVTLSPGQTALLYTDGFEIACPGTGSAASGKIRKPTNNYVAYFQQLFKDQPLSAHPAAALTAQLAELLDEQAGSLHQPDDITALAICPTRQAVQNTGSATKAA
jgi:sigma-B regulation protein RsbU (phosphoserine phosphatase)